MDCHAFEFDIVRHKLGYITRHDEDDDEDQAADADENEVAVLSMEVP